MIFREVRKAAELTQAQLAEKAHLTLNVIYEIENHIREGKLDTLRKVANILAEKSNFTSNDLLIIHYTEMIHGITREVKKRKRSVRLS